MKKEQSGLQTKSKLDHSQDACDARDSRGASSNECAVIQSDITSRSIYHQGRRIGRRGGGERIAVVGRVEIQVPEREQWAGKWRHFCKKKDGSF